jgi:hypothetical protein
MINFQTKNEYSGGNLDILAEAGYTEDDYVLTFKQAMNVFKVTGDMLKGLKGLGTSLFFFKEEINKELAKKRKSEDTLLCSMSKMLKELLKKIN